MAVNYPGPYEVEQKYTVDGIQHVFRLNFKSINDYVPGDLYTAMTMTRQDGTETLLQPQYETVFNAVRAFFSTTDFSMDELTIWKYAPGTFDRTFITSLSTPAAGTAPEPYSPAHSNIFTFRTFEGGIAKLVLLETVSTSNAVYPYAAANAAAQTVFDSITNPNSGWLGRDTSFMLAPLKLSMGQNEAVWRKRFR